MFRAEMLTICWILTALFHSACVMLVECLSTKYYGESCHRRLFLQESSSSIARVGSSIVLLTAAATAPAQALTPNQAEQQYDTYAKSYDVLDGGSASSFLGIEEARRELIGTNAQGNVLEIGAGTGLNLDKYRKGSISSLTLVDISENMLSEAKQKLDSLSWHHHLLDGVRVNFVKADATKDLVHTFGEASFDTVVDSFSLCVMGDQGARDCLQQLVQVVRPTGEILLLENSRADNAIFAKYQDVTAGVAANLGGKGCAYNQDVTAMLRSTQGIDIVETKAFAGGVFRSYRCKRSNRY